jgi:uncharacterized protein YdbL (DUF1318 family)
MTTLYELTASFMEVLGMAQDPNIDPQAITDTLEMIEGEIEEKADGYAKVIKELEADANKLTAEITRLTDRKQALQNNIKNMKQSLTNAMQLTGKTKFKTDLFSFNVQKNPPSLVIDDDTKIPQEFYVPQEPKIDTSAIKELLKSGEAVEYAHLEQSEGVRIR